MIPVGFQQSTITLTLAGMLLVTLSAAAQRPTAVSRFERSGTVHSIKAGQITVQHGKGSRQVYKIQDRDEQAISLEGGQFIFSMPAKINVSGELDAELAERGMVVSFRTRLSRFGKQESAVNRIRMLSHDTEKLAVRFDREPEDDAFEDCRVVAKLIRYANGKLILEVPKSRVARRERLNIKLTDDAVIEIFADNLSRIRPGDRVNSMKGVNLSSGDAVIREIDVALTGKRIATSPSFHDQLELKFIDLPDTPGPPRQEISEHFILHTDISERSAKILLAKLETMHALISKYFRHRPLTPIECYVVRDLDNWARKIPPIGIQKIAEGAGVTQSVNQGGIAKSVVYSCDKHGVVQHEAVHAFCNQAFGSTGPVWYAEGMAEMGQYWKPNELEVNIDPVVIEFLANSRKKSMREIVKANQITGDSWQAYAWRWALCHLLATNPNYSRRFKQLGIELMLNQGDTFESTFGKQADEISFEYDQFTQNLGNGYRVDLCAWDWKTRPRKIDTNRRARAIIHAERGWQATGLELQAGVSYDFVTNGTWQISEMAAELTADGDEYDSGRLIGVIFKDYQLIHPITLGKRGSFVAPDDGHLFLRCDDLWTELSDNKGNITVYFRKSKNNSESGEASDNDSDR